MTLRSSAWVLTAALLLPGACTVQDTFAPVAPTFDPMPERTSRTTILVSGYGEPGGTVEVTRNPPFPAEFKVPALTADASNARFSAILPLAEGKKNRFGALVVDSAGLRSPEAFVDVIQGAADVTGITLDVDNPRIALGASGRATLRLRARVRLSDPTGELAGTEVRFAVTGYAATVPEVSVRTDDEGFATASISSLAKLGPGRVTVSVPTAGITDAAPFEVLPGEPASATLTLTARVNGQNVTGTSLTIPAGTEVAAKVVAKDAGGNEVPAGWFLSVAPADVAIAGGVMAFYRAGSYEVSGYAKRSDGTPPARGVASVTVTTAAAGASARLLSSVPASAVSGAPFEFGATAVDTYGNTLPVASWSATVDDPAATIDAAAHKITPSKSGPLNVTVKATLGDGSSMTAPAARVDVAAGTATRLTMLLGGQLAPLSSPRAMEPGASLELSWSALDAAGNAIADPAVSLVGDRGLDLFGRTLTAASLPGTYAVNAAVVGSEARAVVAVRVQAGAAAAIRPSCPATIDAGVAFACSGVVTDARGNVLDAPIVWSVAAPTSGTTVASGRITIQVAGTARVLATTSGLATPVESQVLVRPGRPTSLRLTLTPETAVVGTSVQVAGSVTDAFLNPIALPIRLRTDAPGAVTTSALVTNLSRTGAWRVFGEAGDSVSGVVTANVTLTVTAAAAAGVSISVSPDVTTAGVPVAVVTRVTDPSGNAATGTPTLLVDGLPIDNRTSVLSGGLLTLFTPGSHRISAVLASATASRVVDVRPSADRTAPVVTVALDRTTAASGPLYAPGNVVRMIVRAADASGIAGVRVRLSGADFGELYAGAKTFSQRVLQVESTFSVTLPTTLVGKFTAAAVATDLAGNSSDATPVPGESDFHAGRVTFTSDAPSGAVARSASIDPALGYVSGLAFNGTVLHASTIAAPVTALTANSTVNRIGAGGAPTVVWTLGNQTRPWALASLTASGTPTYLFAPTVNLTTNALGVVRLAPGANVQTYVTPPFATSATLTVGGVDTSRKSSAPLVYVAQWSTDDTTTELGRLWSLTGKTTPVASVAPGDVADVAVLPLAAFRPRNVCVQDIAAPTTLYFTGERYQGTIPTRVRKVGLYAVTLQTSPAGHVPATGTPLTIVEEDAVIDASNERVYGPCVHAAGSGSAATVLLTRWTLNSTTGATSTGAVAKVAFPCSTCSLLNIATGATGTPLGAMPGIVRGVSGAPGDVSAVFVAEGAAARVFRLDGVF